MRDIKGLGNLITHIQSCPSPLYKNIPNKVRQSAVSVIFRLNPTLTFPSLPSFQKDDHLIPYPSKLFVPYLNNLSKQNSESSDSLIDILFIKRAANIKDVHSGQISFPGGKLDGNENDFEGCVREVNEEVGLDLYDDNSFAFLGKLPTNFFAYYKNSLKTMLSVHLFFMQNNTIDLKISPSEVDFAFWTPLDSFLNPNSENITFLSHDKAPINFIKRNDQCWDAPIWTSVFKGFKSIQLPGLKMPNEEILFGLTFTVMIHMLNLMIKEEREVNCLLREMIRNTANIQASYERDLLRIKSMLTEKIYYHQRLKQFLHKNY